jgi:hypothetical protein
MSYKDDNGMRLVNHETETATVGKERKPCWSDIEHDDDGELH